MARLLQNAVTYTVVVRMSKRFSKTPEKFGTGHPEGLIEAGASNNASLASGSVPALLWPVFSWTRDWLRGGGARSRRLRVT